jgi:DNA-binding transcriptional MerR regulator
VSEHRQSATQGRWSEWGAAHARLEEVVVERRSPGGGPGAVGGGGHGSGGGGGALGAGSETLLAERDLKAIEREHPEGLTSVQVVDAFARRGIRFSEATFRKFVQKGLVPRSRRVGRKGKHQGSLGLYPASVVRRINVIKRLQAEGHTIEDIGRRFLRYRDEIEALERGLSIVLDGFEEELRAPHFDTKARKLLKKDLDETREHALELLKQIESIERRVVGPTDRPPGAGAPGGAEDLL